MDDLIREFEGKTTLAQHRVSILSYHAVIFTSLKSVKVKEVPKTQVAQIHGFTVSLFAQTIKSYQTPLLDIQPTERTRPSCTISSFFFLQSKDESGHRNGIPIVIHSRKRIIQDLHQ